MKCINFRIRTRNYEKYLYCTKRGKEIEFKDCSNCKYKEFKPIKELKKKSNKLKKIEAKRFSIITDNLKVCYVCKKKKKDDLNEIFEGSNRQMSMTYGLVIPICRQCHIEYDLNKELRQKYQREAQKKFEEKYGHDLFMQEFKKNYL